MRALLPLLVAATLAALLTPTASADPTDVCADHYVNVDYDLFVEGSVCHEGHATVCDPFIPTKCWTLDWCTFCPGPVLA